MTGGILRKQGHSKKEGGRVCLARGGGNTSGDWLGIETGRTERSAISVVRQSIIFLNHPVVMTHGNLTTSFLLRRLRNSSWIWETSKHRTDVAIVREAMERTERTFWECRAGFGEEQRGRGQRILEDAPPVDTARPQLNPSPKTKHFFEVKEWERTRSKH